MEQRKHPFSDYLKLKKQRPNATWDDFQRVEQIYTHHHLLPPLLSPQLPGKYDRDIPVMLSPTLPARYVSPEPVIRQNGGNSYTWIKDKKSLIVRLTIPKSKKGDRAVGLGITVDKSGYHSKFQDLLEVAKRKKHQADALRENDVTRANVTFIDCIVVYLVGFHYEDQHRRHCKKLYNEKTWLSLVSLVEHVIQLSQESGYPVINALCYHVRAVVYEHISRILDEYIQLDMVKRRKKELGNLDLLMDRMKSQIRYRELARRSLEKGDQELNIFKLITDFPGLVDHYKRQAVKDPVMDPSKDNVQLPLTATVGISELSAYTLRIIQQWCADQGVEYTDWSF